MKIIPLFSGSSGNSTLIKSESGNILIDAGISLPKLLKMLKMHGESLESISAILITHTHKDHVSGMQRLVFSKPHMKVFGGADAEKYALCTGFESFSAGDKITVANKEISIFPVPHDVPCYGFTVTDGVEKIGYATDIGEVTDNTIAHLEGAKTVMIESNYDDTLLENGDYPIFLKRRISSVHGHLSNSQCQKACEKLFALGTQNFILAHLSEQNNTPEIAYQHVRDGFSQMGAKQFCDYNLTVAKRGFEAESLLD